MDRIVHLHKKSNNELHYIDEERFVVFNKIKGFIKDPYSYTRDKQEALIFDSHRSFDERHQTVVVSNSEGEYLIDKNGRCSFCFEFIGKYSEWDGSRPVMKIQGDLKKWGYLLPDLRKFNEKYLFTPANNELFFVATKVGGYIINGWNEGTNTQQYLFSYNPNSLTTRSKKIPGITHQKFITLKENASNNKNNNLKQNKIFFLGVTIGVHGKEIFSIYRINKVNIRGTNLTKLERPFCAPDKYLNVDNYLGQGMFQVTGLNGLKSILYFDSNIKEFVYWPETERRKFVKYRFNGEILIAEKDDGFFAIIHKTKGCLTSLWEKVDIKGEEVEYWFNGECFSTTIDKIEESLENTLSKIKEKYLSVSSNKDEVNINIKKETHSINNNEVLNIDFITATSHIKRYGNDPNELQVKSQRKILGETQGSKVKERDIVGIIDIIKNKLYIGEIKNTRISKEYFLFNSSFGLEIEETKDIEKNVGFYRINLECSKKDIVKCTLDFLRQKKAIPKPEKILGRNQNPINIDKININNKKEDLEMFKTIRKIYSNIKVMEVPEDKIISGLLIIFKEQLLSLEVKGRNLFEIYKEKKQPKEELLKIFDYIKNNCLSERDRFIYESDFHLYTEYDNISFEQALIKATNRIPNFQNLIELIKAKLNAIKDQHTIEDLLKDICSGNFEKIIDLDEGL